jgi:hypothetical protein
MKILFCDLCNESVPQSELDEGRAFMRKGRVVCGQCDRLMTQREQHAQPGSAPAGPFGSTAKPASANPEAALTSLASAPGQHEGPGMHAAAHGHPHSGHHHAHAPHARNQRSGSGVAVALFSMALTAGVFYWLTERSDRISEAVDARIKGLQTEQVAADRRAMDRSIELESSRLQLEERLKLAAEQERKALEVALENANKQQTQALAALSDLRPAIGELKAVLPIVQRHDGELLEGTRKISAAESRLAALEVAQADLKRQMELRPGPAAPVAAPATPVGTPAWMGLVKDLESANNGDRWVAVSGLGETRDPAVAEYLLPRLKDVDIFVRMATARVLGDLKSPKATGALIEALNDQDSSVREAAYISLCTITNKNFPFEAHQDQADRSKRIKVWQDWWKKAQDELPGAAQ